MIEHLVSCAIERDGVVEARGFKSHWEIRAALGDDSPSRSMEGDREGFLTNEDRFVDRGEGQRITLDAGQTRYTGWPFLSSFVDKWEPVE